MWSVLPLLVIIGLAQVGIRIAFDPFLHCTTDVRAAAIQPASSPVLLTVHIVNRGDAPVRYSCFGRPYPEGASFKTNLTDAKGNIREVSIFNDQDTPGSRHFGELPSGKSVDMPAMIIQGLPVGSYTIQVRGGQSTKVAIKDDPDLARKWDEELVAKISKGDPFADHVASILLRSKKARPALVGALVRGLSSEDEKEVERVANTLGSAQELPASAELTITKALRKHLELAKIGALPNTWILGSLATMASQIGTDTALEPVLELAHTPKLGGNAVWALGKFKQERAAKELRPFMKDENDKVEFRTAQRLAERKDPKALETLLVIANDPKNHWRKYSFETLLNYPNDPRVEKAIQNGVDNGDPSDPRVRVFAEIALRRLKELNPNKKP